MDPIKLLQQYYINDCIVLKKYLKLDTIFDLNRYDQTINYINDEEYNTSNYSTLEEMIKYDTLFHAYKLFLLLSIYYIKMNNFIITNNGIDNQLLDDITLNDTIRNTFFKFIPDEIKNVYDLTNLFIKYNIIIKDINRIATDNIFLDNTYIKLVLGENTYIRTNSNKYNKILMDKLLSNKEMKSESIKVSDHFLLQTIVDNKAANSLGGIGFSDINKLYLNRFYYMATNIISIPYADFNYNENNTSKTNKIKSNNYFVNKEDINIFTNEISTILEKEIHQWFLSIKMLYKPDEIKMLDNPYTYLVIKTGHITNNADYTYGKDGLIDLTEELKTKMNNEINQLQYHVKILQKKKDEFIDINEISYQLSKYNEFHAINENFISDVIKLSLDHIIVLYNIQIQLMKHFISCKKYLDIDMILEYKSDIINNQFIDEIASIHLPIDIKNDEKNIKDYIRKDISTEYKEKYGLDGKIINNLIDQSDDPFKLNDMIIVECPIIYNDNVRATIDLIKKVKLTSNSVYDALIKIVSYIFNKELLNILIPEINITFEQMTARRVGTQLNKKESYRNGIMKSNIAVSKKNRTKSKKKYVIPIQN